MATVALKALTGTYNLQVADDKKAATGRIPPSPLPIGELKID
jgi:hypothetical protein